MDYQSQTMSTDEMNAHLESMLAEVRNIQNTVELSIDQIDAAFEAASKRLDVVEQKLDEEYAALEAIDRETETEIDEQILARIEDESKDES